MGRPAKPWTGALGPSRKLSYHQRYYRAHPDYQERSRKGAAERYAKLKREGGPELRIVQIRKALYQRRQILNKHLDAVEYQEKRMLPLAKELQVLLNRRVHGSDRNSQV